MAVTIKSVSKMLATMKVAIYIRVSTHWQVDKDSLKVQERELIAYCELVLGIKDYAIFTDPGYSAKNTDRPDYQKMMARLRTGEFSHLLVWKIDRISRNLLDFANMYAELKQLGITFVSKNEQFDTSSAIGEAMLKIILVFAELERNMTSERVSAVMVSRAENGQWNGGRVPYGYSYDKETHQFSLDPNEHKVYMRICDLYEFNKSCNWVSNKLNEEGHRTKTGNKWTPTAIHKILTNPFYYGVYRYNIRIGENGPKRDESEWVLVENHHVAAIPKERFDRINYTMRRNKRGGNQRGVSVQRKNEHIFAGLLECGICGSKMTSTPGKRRSDGWSPSNYGCFNRRKGPSSCSSKFVSDISIAPFVIQYLTNMIRVRCVDADKISLTELSKLLLQDDIFDEVSHIKQDGLFQFRGLLQSGAVGLEFTQKAIYTEEPPVADEREILEDQRRRYATAMNRLKALYLYGDEELPEKDFIVERKRILDAIAEIDEKLTKFEGEPELDFGADFTKKASYFIMVDTMLSDKAIDPVEMVRSIEPEVIKSFLNTVLSKVVVTNGHVTEIHFKNGMAHKFIYK